MLEILETMLAEDEGLNFEIKRTKGGFQTILALRPRQVSVGADRVVSTNKELIEKINLLRSKLAQPLLVQADSLAELEENFSALVDGMQTGAVKEAKDTLDGFMDDLEKAIEESKKKTSKSKSSCSSGSCGSKPSKKPAPAKKNDGGEVAKPAPKATKEPAKEEPKPAPPQMDMMDNLFE